jgi:cobalt/nickel transport system permease protein
MLLAVHISDGILTAPWLIGGFGVAGVLYLLGCWGMEEKDIDELPKIALLTAAFFVITSIHLKVGPTSVHLLATGLLGVLLGRRACLAILVALLLQAVFGHGGFTTLGINSVILAVPALAAGAAFAACQRLALLRLPPVRSAFVAATALIWLLAGAFSLILLYENSLHDTVDVAHAWSLTLSPTVLLVVMVLAGISAVVERVLETAPEFPLGLMIGGLTALATVTLNCLVLYFGVAEDWHQLVLLVFIPHLPIAVLEGIVLGFTVGYLARVKPEMVGCPTAARIECVVDSAS